MKSQDLLILLKLVSLNKDEQQFRSRVPPRQDYLKSSWEGWDSIEEDYMLLEGDLGVSLDTDLSVIDISPELMAQRYSVRSLAASTGIGKTEVNNSVKRMKQVGLVRSDRKTGVPKVNTKALVELIIHAVRYVFPVQMGTVTRGIPTAFSAPILASELSSPESGCQCGLIHMEKPKARPLSLFTRAFPMRCAGILFSIAFSR